MKKRMVTSLALLIGAYGMFVLPWYVSSNGPVKSESYVFGFNNRIAILWLLGTFLGAVLTRIFLFRPAESKNYLDWLEESPCLLPSWKKAKVEYILLGIFSLGMVFEVLFLNHLMKLPYWSEACMIAQIDLVALGFHPYRDFQYCYGSPLLYGPLFLDRLSCGLLGIENAYACFLALTYCLGFLGFFFYLRCLHLTKSHRWVVLTLFCFMWIPVTMGLNYMPLRFTMLMAVIALFHKMNLYKGAFAKQTFSFNFLKAVFVVLAIFFTFSISPEIGCVTMIALLCYVFFLLLKQPLARIFYAHDIPAAELDLTRGFEKSALWLAMSTFIGACGSLLLVMVLFPGCISGMMKFSSGGNNFPVYSNIHNVFLLIALIAVLPLLAVSILQHLTDVRAPLAVSLLVGAVGMLPAALGRCDPGHIMINDTLLFILLFPAAAFAGRKRWMLFCACFTLLVGLLYLSYWGHYKNWWESAFNESRFYFENKETVHQWEKNWENRKKLSQHGAALNWHKTIPYPKGIEALDSLGRIAAPFGIDVSLERFLKLQNSPSPFSYDRCAEAITSPKDVTSMVSSLLTYDVILLPKDAEQYKIFRINKKNYEEQNEHFLSALMFYPVHCKIINDPYMPQIDLIQQLLPRCEQIGSMPDWILMKPKNLSYEHKP